VENRMLEFGSRDEGGARSEKIVCGRARVCS